MTEGIEEYDLDPTDNNEEEFLVRNAGEHLRATWPFQHVDDAVTRAVAANK